MAARWPLVKSFHCFLVATSVTLLRTAGCVGLDRPPAIAAVLHRSAAAWALASPYGQFKFRTWLNLGAWVATDQNARPGCCRDECHRVHENRWPRLRATARKAVNDPCGLRNCGSTAGNSSVALSRANAWLPNHAGNERAYWWSLAPELGSDLSHDCPARGRRSGDDSGGGRPPLGHFHIRGPWTTGRSAASN